MGAWGAIIMSFFGAVFAAMTLAFQFHWTGARLGLPFLMFASIAIVALLVVRRPGAGVSPSERVGRVIMWSSIGEGVGLFIAANLATNLGHRELLLPAMALVVGLHFLPIANAARFRPFYFLGFALLALAILGLCISPPSGGTLAGFGAAMALWVASFFAVRRDIQAKSGLKVASLDDEPAGGS